MQAVANNPEPLINAAIAAIAAQQSAFQAAILSAILVGMAVIIVIGVVVILVKIDRVETHTNSMREQLVKASRKLGLIEGEAIGRAAEIEEHDNKGG